MICTASCPLVNFSVAESLWSLPETLDKFGLPFLGMDPSQTPTDSTQSTR